MPYTPNPTTYAECVTNIRIDMRRAAAATKRANALLATARRLANEGKTR